MRPAAASPPVLAVVVVVVAAVAASCAASVRTSVCSKPSAAVVELAAVRAGGADVGRERSGGDQQLAH